MQPTVGADLGAFVGRPNTAEVGSELQQRVLSELQQEDLLAGRELQVQVFPTSQTSIAIVLIISPPGSGGQVMLTFTYDMRDNKLVPRNV